MFEDLKQAGIDLSLLEARPATLGKGVIDWLCQLEESEFCNWWKPTSAKPRRLATYGLVDPNNDIVNHPLLRSLNFLGEQRQSNVGSVFDGEIPWNTLRGSKLSTVLRRSKLAGDIYFIDPEYEVLVMGMAQVLSNGCHWNKSSASPANAFAFEFYAQFMDGGVSHFSGDYFIGLKGSWVHGMKAVRFLCSVLGLPQPPRRHFETNVPSEDALWAEQLKENLSSETYEKFSNLGFFPQPEDWEA